VVNVTVRLPLSAAKGKSSYNPVVAVENTHD
jgi:hypothetical protein